MEKIIGDEWDDDEKDKMIGSPSSEGKMVIKLKIPKLPPPAMDGELKSPAEDVIGKRVCLVCEKEFSSGKALGGHMRVHAQSANRNPNFLKPSKESKLKKSDFNNGDGNLKQQRKPYYLNSVNDEGEPTCSQCGKTFPSMKSLFGHMRCHPERVWRGILPPPNTPTPTPAASARRRSHDDDDDNDGGGGGGGDQVVDLTKYLRGWSVTERRGRKALKAADDDEVLLGAVEDLLSLANGGGGGTSTAESGATQMQLTEASNSNSLTNKNSPPIKRRKKMKLMMELELELEHEQNDDVSLPEQQPPVTECKYKCTTCNKCFATHQALGGHKSSHNKSKFTSTDHHQTEEDDYESFVMNQSGENLEKEIDSNRSIHQCKICDKVFATGQALGGHKRCHWTGTTEAAQAPSSQITSTGEAASSGRKVVLDFDLNEIPPTTMEEDESSSWVS